MTSYEFTALELNARADYLWQHGVHLANHVEQQNACVLYSLHSYYVEVITEQGKGILDVVPFKKGERLEKYLAKIML
jgi:hypothetical protein